MGDVVHIKPCPSSAALQLVCADESGREDEPAHTGVHATQPCVVRVTLMSNQSSTEAIRYALQREAGRRAAVQRCRQPCQAGSRQGSLPWTAPYSSSGRTSFTSSATAGRVGQHEGRC